MTNPTTPFNWQMPQSTDLVTDLPADFETFGQAVATSMADLLGGTTGQVLSKASNTDMDFTWVAQDDSNAIQNAIVDAKGDLIAASAADTPARLAVGADNYVLGAASGEATGLKYLGAWENWTPTYQSITIGNGSVIARKRLIGKTCEIFFQITLGSTSSIGTNPVVYLPHSYKNPFGTGNGYYQDGGTQYAAFGSCAFGTAFYLQAYNASSTYSTHVLCGTSIPFSWGTGDIINFNFSYEVE